MPKKENKRQQEMKEIIEKEKVEQQKLEEEKKAKQDKTKVEQEEIVEQKQKRTKGKAKHKSQDKEQNKEQNKDKNLEDNKKENKSINQERQEKPDNKETKEKKEHKEENKKQEENKKSNEKLVKASNNKISKIEEIEKEIKSNRKLPEEQQNQIHTRVFQNIFLAVIIILYLNFIILGFWNIENSVFVVDLKVFSMSILVIAIGVIEYAYKKDSGRHAIHGIETLVLAIATMGFIYLNMMWQEKFIPVVVIVALAFAIYYVAKTIIIYKKMKKQFSLENIKEIIKK